MSAEPAPLATPAGWICSLLDFRFQFSIGLHGFPGRIRMPDRWEVTQGPLAEHLFYFVIEGAFTAAIDGDPMRVQAGDLLWVPAGLLFRFRRIPGETLVVFRFRILPLQKRKVPEALSSALHYPAAWSCKTWMEHLVEEACHEDEQKAERMRGLLLCFFTELARLEAASNRRQEIRFTRTQQATLLDYFAANARRWPGPADLAAQLNLSPDYFSRVFRKTFGQPPRRWLLEQRIRLAAWRMLESKLNLSQVAEEFGYEDLFLFSRQFKAVMGASPSRYRQQHAVNPTFATGEADLT